MNCWNIRYWDSPLVITRMFYRNVSFTLAWAWIPAQMISVPQMSAEFDRHKTVQIPSWGLLASNRDRLLWRVYSNAAYLLHASRWFEGASGTKEFNELVILHVLNTWRCDPSLLIARLVLNLWHPALLSLSEVSTHSQYVFLYTLREM